MEGESFGSKLQSSSIELAFCLLFTTFVSCGWKQVVLDTLYGGKRIDERSDDGRIR